MIPRPGKSTTSWQRKAKCVAKLEKTPLFGVKVRIKKKRPGTDFVSIPGSFMARSTEKDITGFLKNPLVTRLFRTFLYFFLLHAMVCDLSCPFSLRTEKDIIPIKSTSFLRRSVPRVQNIPILLVEKVCAFLQMTNRLVPNIQAPH